MMKITLDAATLEDLDLIGDLSELVGKVESETDAFAQMELVAELAEVLAKVEGRPAPVVAAEDDYGPEPEHGMKPFQLSSVPRTTLVTLTGDEVTGLIDAADAEKNQVLFAARRYFKAKLQSKRVMRAGLGAITINGKVTWDKVKNGLSYNLIRAKSLPALPYILKRGFYCGQEAPEEGKHADAVAFHYFAGWVTVGEVDVELGVSVKQRVDGHYAYNMADDPVALRNKKAASLAGLKPAVDHSPEVATDESDEPTVDSVSDSGSGFNLVILRVIRRSADGTETELPEFADADLEQPEPSDGPERVSETDDGLSDDPNAENYRFKDTGVVAGARKDMVALVFREAANKGQLVRGNAVDWEEVERNPREAAKLITKSNLFGKVDWAGVRARGMDPGAGFLIDRVYAAIAPEAEDAPEKRRSFALGIESLRDRMESCDTADQVTDVLKEIRDEMLGVMLTAKETEDYKAATAAYREAMAPFYAYMTAEREIESRLSDVTDPYYQAENELAKAKRRRLKDTIELEALVNTRRAARDAVLEELKAFKADHPEMQRKGITVRYPDGGSGTRFASDIQMKNEPLRDRAEAILSENKRRNLNENPTTKAWLSLGERFISLLNYQSSKGSTTFAKHVATAKIGKVKDWGWAESETVKVAGATKREVGFQFKVAERHERKGGREISMDSTIALKEAFGLRDVQSGNWVLNDPASAAFHVQRSAEAFADLADLIGIPDGQVSLGGRLAMAFGARGRGNAGFGGGAAAHYEPVQRVINLTKMNGGGALAHEWLHFIDNLIPEAESGKPTSAKDFASSNPELLPDGDLKTAFKAVATLIREGNTRLPEILEYTDKDYRLAQSNIARELRSYEIGGVRSLIKSAAGAAEAVIAVDALYEGKKSKFIRNERRDAKEQKQWRTLAVAFHDGNALGNKVRLGTGRLSSDYEYESVLLDKGKVGKYWSETEEMMARAFQSWCEDTMEAKGLRNTYLSANANNEVYKLDGVKPFPEGDERTRINAAFTTLMAAVRDTGVLGKASANKVLMDSIFGEQAECEGEAA